MIEFDSGVGGSATKSGPTVKSTGVRIKVLGIGGAGCSILSRLNRSYLPKIEFVVLNTDGGSLERCGVEKKLQLGGRVTQGWGTGGDPEIGRQIALEEKDRVKAILYHTDLVFLVSGLGKGTGTGASPVVAQLAKEMGSLTLGFVVLPFYFEGEKRVEVGKRGLQELERALDALMVIPNDILLKNAQQHPSLKEGLRRIDGVLDQVIQALGNLLLGPGLMILDFADIRALLQNQGRIQIAMGKASGKDAAREAAKQVVSSPLSDKTSLKKAKAVLFNIRGGKDLSLSQVEAATLIVQENSCSQAEFVFGASIDEGISEEVTVTLIAAGGKITEDHKKPPSSAKQLDLGVYASDELDIPTFLRKRKN
ncbi:MAG: cell division protein FtsZ [bacterium]